MAGTIEGGRDLLSTSYANGEDTVGGSSNMIAAQHGTSWTISAGNSPGGREAQELLAHGAAFVGRHLEMHSLIRSCLHNQLTAVYGTKGAGKSALVLEAARYLRQRNRFPHGIFCCSLEGLRSMKAVRTRLGNTLKIPARSAQELCELMARYQSCLLILDRCEDVIRKKTPQFVWFLTQLLQQSSVKVLVSSQSPLEGIIDAMPNASFDSITLPPMRSRDAALLLLESCERELTADELGATEEATLLDTLRSHDLLRKIGGMPAAIRWAARQLSDCTVPALLAQIDGYSPPELSALVLSGSPGSPELAGQDVERSSPARLRRRGSRSSEGSFCSGRPQLTASLPAALEGGGSANGRMTSESELLTGAGARPSPRSRSVDGRFERWGPQRVDRLQPPHLPPLPAGQSRHQHGGPSMGPPVEASHEISTADFSPMSCASSYGPLSASTPSHTHGSTRASCGSGAGGSYGAVSYSGGGGYGGGGGYRGGGYDGGYGGGGLAHGCHEMMHPSTPFSGPASAMRSASGMRPVPQPTQMSRLRDAVCGVRAALGEMNGSMDQDDAAQSEAAVGAEVAAELRALQEQLKLLTGSKLLGTSHLSSTQHGAAQHRGQPARAPASAGCGSRELERGLSERRSSRERRSGRSGSAGRKLGWGDRQRSASWGEELASAYHRDDTRMDSDERISQ
uniref:Uncharacterized protein n=1 Tax=Haptolina brevifila TaxID=156173 RepID=A0A7S2JQA6_9EUKA